MPFILQDDQQVAMSVAFVDRFGNPAAVDGVPMWASSDSAILTVTAADDAFGAVVVPMGPLGTAQVSVRADADTGEGVTEIIGVLDVEVVAGAAVSAVITPGAPEARG